MSEMVVMDPSNFHLQKKQLTQIRKAARVLRDPGTTSSWRSPLSTARSLSLSAATPPPPQPPPPPPRPPEESRRVFLYNWRSASQKAKSSVNGENEDDEDGVDGSSVDDSLSDWRNGVDSKSDTYIGGRRHRRHHASMIFRCRDANLVAMGRPSGIKKKKSSKNVHSIALLRHQQQQQQLNTARSGNSKRLLEGILGRDDSVEQSDDTEEYYNSEDFRRICEASPLLSRLRQRNWSRSSSRLLRSKRKDDSSYSYSTPALSTSSYNPYGNRNPSTVESWDGTTASLHDGDDEVDDQLDLPGRQGCGIPCYWSRRSTPRHRGICGSGSCDSPSLSDTIRRKGSSMLCGSQTIYPRRHGLPLGSKKRRSVSMTPQGLLPLLTNSCDGHGGSSMGTGRSDDELSTNFGELDLEALSRLDGRRWSSSCRSQEAMELVALNGEREEEGSPENVSSLSQKYRPMFFDELIGQNIVVQSLVNAISRGRIAPVYLFQGPRGTGKTSTARIFTAALNCLAVGETKPCGICRECSDFISGKSRHFREVDGTNKKGMDRMRYLLKTMPFGTPSPLSPYKVFVIDECHLLPSKTWLAFLKFLEEPPPQVVFIFITPDLENVPRTVLSRCQKYLFNKIKEGDIVARLRKISDDENLDVESDALELIALNADGSLRDAETMLDQLSLLGKRITTSLVNDLVGVVSDEKLLELLELAMSSDTAETVKRARELMDSGVDPIVLMSQLASLIMDIIAGTYHIVDAQQSDSFFGGRSLTEAEMDRLKHALKLLSEAEKQLRVSSERSTWFTATLLQLGSPSPDPTLSGSSRRQSSKTTEDDPSSASRDATIVHKQKPDAHHMPRKSFSPISMPKSAEKNSTHQGDLLSLVDGFNFNAKPVHSQFRNSGASASSHDDVMMGNMVFRCINADKLDDIWERCIERCHSKTLRQLLHAHGKLVSISEAEGGLVAYVAFQDEDIKCRAERFLSSITNSIEIVMRSNVEVKIILLPDGEISMNMKAVGLPDTLGLKQRETTAAVEGERKAFSMKGIDSDLDSSHQELLKVSRGSFNDSEGKLRGGSRDPSNCSPLLDRTFGPTDELAEGHIERSSTKERNQEIPMHRIDSIIREQRLETAWLQVAEKGTPRSMSRLKPEKNQILPQDGSYRQNQVESMNSVGVPSQKWEDELNHEIKVLKINDRRALQKDPVGKRVDHYPISPSSLHDSSFVANFNKESMGYESGTGSVGCNSFFCWNNDKPPKRGKIKQRPPLPSPKVGRGRFPCFGECGKSRKTDSRFKT
ncbi:protein STICHEL [Vitis riparia]|uniref:protein STICHEL n=1 Tax=Vitis riparia TaxID=96939 RepID=UPI00155A2D4B|nr:protein STICHEL [Vitis riparia]